MTVFQGEEGLEWTAGPIATILTILTSDCKCKTTMICSYCFKLILFKFNLLYVLILFFLNAGRSHLYFVVVVLFCCVYMSACWCVCTCVLPVKSHWNALFFIAKYLVCSAVTYLFHFTLITFLQASRHVSQFAKDVLIYKQMLCLWVGVCGWEA